MYQAPIVIMGLTQTKVKERALVLIVTRQLYSTFLCEQWKMMILIFEYGKKPLEEKDDDIDDDDDEYDELGSHARQLEGNNNKNYDDMDVDNEEFREEYRQ